MKHKKPKRSSNKNRKDKKQNKKKGEDVKVPTVDELVEAGDAAVASMEPEKALAIFSSAETLLRKQQEEQSSSPATEATTTTGSATTMIEKYVQVLEKLGDIKASMGDVDSAKQHFQTAITLWTSTVSEENINDNKGKEESAAYQETLAGLYLYIGQLCSEQEALKAYEKGLTCLEKSVQLREKQVEEEIQPQQKENSTTETMMDVEMENNNNTSVNETTQSLLREARYVYFDWSRIAMQVLHFNHFIFLLLTTKIKMIPLTKIHQ